MGWAACWCWAVGSRIDGGSVGSGQPDRDGFLKLISKLISSDLRRFPFSMTRKCKAREEEKTHRCKVGEDEKTHQA